MSNSITNTEQALDLNSLFNLNYNFDILKKVIENLLTGNKSLNQKVNDVIIKLEKKEEMISKLEDKVNILNNEHFQANRTDNALEPNTEIDPQMNDSLSDLKKRVNYLEIKLSTVQSFSQDLEDIKAKHKQSEKNSQNNQKTIKDLLDKINNISENYEKLENQHYLLNERLSENPFFKTNGKNLSLNNTNISNDGEDLSFQFKSFEKKASKKFEFLDERNKAYEEDLARVRNEISLLKNSNENTNRNFESAKSEMDSIEFRINEAVKATKNMEDRKLSSTAFEEKMRIHNKIYDKKIEDIATALENLRETFINNPADHANNSNNNNNNLDSKDAKVLKDLQKRFAEIEKNFKTFSASINVELMNKDMKDLNDNVNSKFESSHQKMIDLSESLKNLSLQQNFLKESIESLQEDHTAKDDLLWFRKKIENLTNQINTLKSNEDSKNNSNNNIKQVAEGQKYLEVQAFFEFKSALLAEVNGLSRRCDELGRLVDDIMNSLDAKPTAKDLKNIDESFRIKLEEMRIASQKRFADKNEMGNKYKYLDAQIKSILDAQKAKEKGDNWLLAKKPVNGYSCASCEAYIGDLQETTQPVHWNKYPNREFGNDPNKLYRVGSGFSKMLQLLNFEGNNPNNNPNAPIVVNNPNTSSQVNLSINQSKNHNKYLSAIDFYKPNNELNSEANVKRDLNLPKVKIIDTKRKLNASLDNIEEVNLYHANSSNVNNNNNPHNYEEMEDSPIHPKVVKIYKRIKDKKENN